MSKLMWKKLGSAASLALVAAALPAATVDFVAAGSAWSYRLGTNEASTPVTTWRTNVTDTAGWSASAPTPFGYGEPGIATTIPESDAITPNWLSVFMRRTFVVNDVAQVASASLSVTIDDGFIVWINGVEVTPRYNVAAGEPTIATAATTAAEPVGQTLTVPPGVLRTGTNVIAIQAFNANVTSSDLLVNASLTGTIDDVPPGLAFQLPFAGSTIPSLTQIEVDFTEAVTGVTAADLLINGAPATNVTVLSPTAYVFRFPPPATGPVSVAFAAGHGIQDLATVPNAFAGASWNYTLDPNVIISQDVRLNEFVAINGTGLRDEDNEYQDWVEIRNLSTNLVSLAGWSLTDDTGEPDKWVFPAITMQPSGYLVVFCSGKDRKPTAPNGRLHTNFKLGTEDESILLYNSEVPRQLISSINSYPLQRRDYSYGYDPLGLLKYFSPPTPGSNNPPSSITGIVADTKFSHDRGFYSNSFSLSITCATAGASIRYTLNGQAPTTASGTLYTGPITITNTTVVRAMAYKTDLLSSDVDCHTYLYIDTVPTQAANGVAPAGWPATWGGNVVDYGMDPDIVNNVAWSGMITNALRAIPTFSVVMNLDDMFGAASGIYANPGQDGPLWERPASIELLNPDGEEGFQINCGIRLRGGFSRSTDNPKHAMRVFFRQEYGASKLNFPFFGPTGAKSFDKFDMRTMQNYSWSFQNDSRMVCLRDVMSRDAQLAMNGLSTRGNFYHLYINGMYWGLYNSEERPEAAFAESYVGGREEDYDTIKQLDGYISGATDGNTDAWYRLWQAATNGFASNADYFKVQGRNPDGTINTNYENLVDVPNLIDYVLVINYGGNLDAPISAFLGNDSPNNWYGFRDRSGQHGGFRFVSHDAEHTLLNTGEDRTGIVDLGASGGQYGVIQADWTCGNPLTQSGGAAAAQQRSTPQYIWFRMIQNPEFRLLAADRIYKHCFNNGALSVPGLRSAFLARSNEIQLAIVAESARWGDAKNATPYTRNSWVSAMNGVMGFINARTPVLVSQMQADGLYPAISPPAFNAAGGVVANGFVFRMTNSNPSGVVYYTLDGSDPRVIGGAVSPSALAYAAPLTINYTTTVRARVLSGGVWSALNEATFYPPQDLSKLLVTEIMYHPPIIGAIDGDEFEFIELKNVGASILGLGGLSFTGINYTFPPNATLAPGAFYVLAANGITFDFKYPGVGADGYYTGRLANSGENLGLFHPLGAQVFSFTFGDFTPWPVTADGYDFSLVPVNPNLNPDYNDPVNWRASSHLGGSPGADDPAVTLPPVLINEVLTHSETGVDFIELFNPTTNTVDVGGWFLTDDLAMPKKFRIPNGTSLAPLGYVVFTETNFNPMPGTSNSFSFNSHGDDAYLFSGDTNTNLTGYAHGFSFAAAPDGETFGRYLNSTGEEHFPGQVAPTPGAANAGPRVGPVVINEIHYNPAVPFAEFIELKNLSSNAVPLFDAFLPTNTWRLNGLGFTFPTNLTLPAGGFLLLVGTNVTAFTNQYLVPAGVPIIAYPGNLQDSGERLELQQPDTTGTNGVGFIDIDVVRYNDRAPWSPAADGSGPSLQRRLPSLYGNDPANWKAAAPTPGQETSGGDEPTIIAHPQSQGVLLGGTATFSVVVTGTPPFQFVWRLNGTNLPGATAATLVLTNTQSHQAGVYSVNVLNSAGFTVSSNATLSFVTPVTITAQPANQSVLPGTNVTLSVGAISSGTIRYQWRFEGVDIPGATNASHSFTNANLNQHHGNFSVLVFDAISSALSTNASIFVLVKPVVVTHIVGQSVPFGGTATFTCLATGAPPNTYRWVRGGSQYFASTNPVLVISNVTASTTIRVAATNLASASVFSPGGLTTVPLTVIACTDCDGDGMLDSWEIAYLGGTNASPTLDSDGDGINNGDEFRSGTNPTNALSVLKMVFATTNAGSLTFVAQSNLSYSVQWRTNLIAPAWTNLTSILASPLVRTIAVDSAAAPAAGERYFRVVTPMTP